MTTSTTRHWPATPTLPTGWRAPSSRGWTGQHLGHPERSKAVTVHRAHPVPALRRAPAARSCAARTARRQSATAGCHRW